MINVENKLVEIEALLKKNYALNKGILTLEEAADFLGLSKSALYKMTSKREISYYSPGGKKVYFNKADLENWIFGNKVPSVEEYFEQVEEFVKNPIGFKS